MLLVTLSQAMRTVAASTIYSSLGKNLKASLLLLSGAHLRSHRVAEYEAAFARMEGASFGLATSLARMSWYHILRALEVKPGERVLMSPVTIPEMLAVVEALELEPVFVDFAPKSLFPDAEDLRLKARASGARVFLLTYLSGQIGDLGELRKVAAEEGVVLVQDATQAPLSQFEGQSLSAWAEVTFFSSCELKFVHTFRGAVVCTNSSGWANKLRFQLDTAKRRPSGRRLAGKVGADAAAWLVLEPNFFGHGFHLFSDRIFVQDPFRDFRTEDGTRVFGSDYLRMRESIPDWMLCRASDFEARLGLHELRLIENRVQRHREIASHYRGSLEDLSILPRTDRRAQSSDWRFPVTLTNAEVAERVRRTLRQQRIIAERTGLSLLSRSSGEASQMLAATIFLPCHAGLTDDEVERIAKLARVAVEGAQ